MSEPADAPASSMGLPAIDPRTGSTILIVLAAAALLVSYVETMLVPALPTLVRFYDGVPYTTIAWVVSLYLLVGVATLPLTAKLGDLVGKKKVLVTLLAIYTFAVALAPFTPQLATALGLSRFDAVYLLIGVRGLQGVGLAMFPLALALIGEEMSPANVGPAQGIVAAMYAVGASAGLFGGAWIIQTAGWQAAYETVLVPAALVLLLIVFVLPESRHLLAARMDVLGAGLLGGALATFLLGLTMGPTWGWTAWNGALGGSAPLGTPELFALAAAIAIAFVLWERRAAEPMIDLARFKERNIGLSYLGALLVGTAILATFVGLTVLVELPVVGLGKSILQFGEMSLPTTFAMMVAAPLVGKGIARFGPRPMVLAGAALSSVGFLLLLADHGNFLAILLEAMPTFAGLVAVLVSVTNVIILSARKGETGIHTGMTEMFQDLGSSIGPVLVSALLASWTTTRAVAVLTPQGVLSVPEVFPSPTAFSLIFTVGLALSLGLGAVGLLLRNSIPGAARPAEVASPGAGPRPHEPEVRTSA